jgi:hypothetical protein
MTGNVGGVFYLVELDSVKISSCVFNDTKASSGCGGALFVEVKLDFSVTGIIFFFFFFNILNFYVEKNC